MKTMTQALKRCWPAAATWAVAWALLLLLWLWLWLWLDGSVDLANLAMVLASAAASLWLPMGGAVALSLAGVLA